MVLHNTCVALRVCSGLAQYCDCLNCVRQSTTFSRTLRPNVADFHPQCPKCEKFMDRGHLPDVSHGTVLQSSWAPGEAERRRFFGGIKYHAGNLIPLSAYRCPGCGYVEFYARPA